MDKIFDFIFPTYLITNDRSNIPATLSAYAFCIRRGCNTSRLCDNNITKQFLFSIFIQNELGNFCCLSTAGWATQHNHIVFSYRSQYFIFVILDWQFIRLQIILKIVSLVYVGGFLTFWWRFTSKTLKKSTFNLLLISCMLKKQNAELAILVEPNANEKIRSIKSSR